MKDQKEQAKKVADEVADRSREIWLAGLGLFSAIEEQGSKLFNEFRERGEDFVKEGEKIEKKGIEYGKEIKDGLEQRFEETRTFVEDKVSQAMDAMGFNGGGRKADVEDLTAKVDHLTKTVEELTKQLKKEKKTATKKKSTRKKS